MKQYRVAVIGATGMVGQRFVSLLENHPWFTVTALAASSHSAGKTYEQAVGSRWMMSTPIPKSVAGLVVQDAVADAQQIAHSVDFAFCAVDMKKEEIRALEETYAKYECPVMSNNSAHRFTPDVPMIDQPLQGVCCRQPDPQPRCGSTGVESAGWSGCNQLRQKACAGLRLLRLDR